MKNRLIVGFALIMSLSACGGVSEVTSETSQLLATCASCHGENGISSNTMWPNLAGQQRDYLIKEMRAFRDGTRSDPSMPASLLEGLSDEQLASIAEDYSVMEQAKPAPLEANSPGKNVRANCVSCHGMTGISVTSIWPNIAAQKEGYLKKQLLDYKSGKRQHPTMAVITNELTDAQLADVAKYYSQH